MRRGVLWLAVVWVAGICVAAGPGDSDGLKVISFNILHGVNLKGENTLVAQAEMLRDEKPDFVALQEVDVNVKRSAGVDQVKVFRDVTGMHGVFGPHYDYQGGQYGLGLLSRYPLSEARTDRISLVNTDGTTETRALLSATAHLDDGSTVTVASVHMGLNQATRLLQAQEMVRYLAGRGRVILCGDFNAEPGTPELKTLEQVYRNADPKHGLTFPVGKPVKTIDYIMVQPKTAGIKNFAVMDKVDTSDHYPITAVVEF